MVVSYYHVLEIQCSVMHVVMLVVAISRRVVLPCMIMQSADDRLKLLTVERA